jgi:hypothetical protein
MNLSELLKLGIIASIGGDGGLQLDAPKGALTPELIERIRHHKPSLLAEIQMAREVGERGELHFLCTNPAGEELPPAGDVHRETPTDTAPPIRATRWLLHYADREPMEVHFAPAADHAEALAAYRDAVAAEPAPERTDTGAASVIERDELLALVEAVYAGDTDADRAEALDAALADPAGALTCYRGIAAERGITVVRADARQSSAQSARQSVQQSVQQSAARNCSTCRHRKRPGLSAGYCGGGRGDLAGAYGLHHPLRKLPADQGASCASYMPHEG